MSTLAVPLPGSPALKRSLARAEARRKLRAVALTLPLLAFLLLTFLVPIGALLQRAIENPEVAGSLARTGQAV
jgi:putative spermidine/putrescine transport system permease protein